MFAGCIHPVFASARRRPAAVAERECQSAAVRKKAKKADEKAKIHVGARMVIGRQKAAAGPLGESGAPLTIGNFNVKDSHITLEC